MDVVGIRLSMRRKKEEYYLSHITKYDHTLYGILTRIRR
jgi:hypothetical protein